MNRLLALVTVMSLFVAGIAIGALGMHIYQDRYVHRHDEPPGPGVGFAGRRLHSMLDLSAEQMRKIDAILEQSHRQAMELRDDLHPRVMAIMERAQEEIAGILDPEQREKFQQLLQDNRRRAEYFFLGPPPGPRGGRGDRYGRGGRGPWGGPGRRPWGPPPQEASPDAPPPGWQDQATPEQPPDSPPGPPDEPGRD